MRISLAYLIDLGWLHIGPPYIYINMNPILLQLGPLAIRWYGLMYVVGIIVGLLIINSYTRKKGITEDMIYRILWWCIVAGLLGGRLYFVIQQPDLVSHYLLQPQNILATWEGGMAFYGAVFLVIPTLYWRARREHINPLVLIDAGVLFAAAGQIFGRIGNLINGDIIGYPSTLPWSTVYQNPNSWACLDPLTCNVPVQPAAGYELLCNLVLLGVMLYLARKVTRPGILMLVYLFSYSITQFLVFFTRSNDYVNFLNITSLKQAQWTSIFVFILLLPVTYLVLRVSRPIPAGEVAATYGIPQGETDDNTDTEQPEVNSPEPSSDVPADQNNAQAERNQETAAETTAVSDQANHIELDPQIGARDSSGQETTEDTNNAETAENGNNVETKEETDRAEAPVDPVLSGEDNSSSSVNGTNPKKSNPDQTENTTPGGSESTSRINNTQTSQTT